MSTIIDHALEYLELGLTPIPIHPELKKTND